MRRSREHVKNENWKGLGTKFWGIPIFNNESDCDVGYMNLYNFIVLYTAPPPIRVHVKTGEIQVRSVVEFIVLYWYIFHF